VLCATPLCVGRPCVGRGQSSSARPGSAWRERQSPTRSRTSQVKETIAQRHRGCSLSRVRVNGVIVPLRPGGRSEHSNFITGSTNFTTVSFICNHFTAVDKETRCLSPVRCVRLPSVWAVPVWVAANRPARDRDRRGESANRLYVKEHSG